MCRGTVQGGPGGRRLLRARLKEWKRLVALRLGMVAATWVACAGAVYAQNATLLEEQFERVRNASTVSPLGPTPFGERVDLMTGALSFYATDVEVPLNSGLPLKLARKFDTTKHYGGPGGVPNDHTRVLGPNWDLDVPYMRGVFDLRTGWVGTGTNQNGSLNRCSQGMAPPDVPGQIQFSNRTYSGSDYSGGAFINIPGAGEEEVLALSQSRPRPSDGTSYVATTRSEMRISCITSMQRGAGEGFVAVLSNGTKYYFDWMWKRDFHHIMDMYCSSAQGGIYVIVWGGSGINCSTGVALPRSEVFIYATRVEDRFGNSLTYHYDPDPTRPFRLTSITSSEGASISLDYDGDGKLLRAHNSGRVWDYAYTGSGDSKNLSSVTLPGGLSWQYSGGTVPYFVPATTLWDVCNVRVGTMRSDASPTPGEASTFTVTHPGGATGEFKVRRIVQGTNRTWGNCELVRFGYVTSGFDAPVFHETPKAYVGIALYEKTVSGLGIPVPLRWTYQYQPSWSWLSECNSGQACSNSTRTKVTAPDGVATTYSFGNSFIDNYGLLLDETITSSDGVQRRRTDFQYVMDAAGQPFPANVGATILSGRSVPVRARFRPLRQKVLQQDGLSLQSISNSYDQFARPVSVTASGNGPSQTREVLYHDDLNSWVVGQIKERRLDGVLYEETTYDSRALPSVRKEFGRVVQVQTYAQDGTLATISDGNQNTTTLSDWKRGIAQNIRFPVTPDSPQGAVRRASVSDRGWIDSLTDENGYQTLYGYDDAGRLTRIEHPTNDLVDWNVETINYEKAPYAAYGLSAGQWVQTHRVGKRVSSVWFDALQRPVLSQTYDDTAYRYGSTVSQVVRRYDAGGRLSFESYPLRRAGDSTLDWTTESLGTSTWYDALGRATRVRRASELGSLDTETFYLSAGRVQVVNARQKPTTTTYRLYDEPSYSLPIRIEEPEGVTTEIARDGFGAAQAITRTDSVSGTQIARQFSYNDYHQLCRVVQPENGGTFFGYDGAGNLTWVASGLSGATPCGPKEAFPPGELVSRGYDARNRLIAVTFPDDRGSQNITYWPDGLVRSIATFNLAPMSRRVDNTYSYNKRRLLSSETITDDDNFSWSAGYTYDRSGSLSGLLYPSGLRVDYAPNALGQPTRAGDFATSARYWPNGGIAGFTYGNGLEHVATQNDRGLVELSSDGLAIFNDGYDYDQVGNVAAISDGTAGGVRNRDMLYDARDRLLYAAGPSFGSASYAYDNFDNLTRVSVAAGKARDVWYCYDGSNRLTNVKTGSCNGSTVVGLGYDSRGNVINNNGKHYDFDFGGRLRAAIGVESYSYDGNGLRVVARNDEGAVRSFYTRSGQLLSTRNERTKELTDFVSLSGKLVARVRTDTTVPFLYAEGGDGGIFSASWSAVSGATRYDLEHSFASTTTVEPYGPSFLRRDFSEQPVGLHTLRIRACFEGACRPWSTPAVIDVGYKPSVKPVLSAPANSFDGYYAVTWGDVPHADKYEFEEWSGVAWVRISSFLDILRWDFGGRPDGTYRYRVRGCNKIGCGPDADEVAVVVIRPPNGVPTITVATQNATGTYSVSWNSNIPGATRYELDELVLGAWSTYHTTTASVPISGRDTGAYSYKVRACNASCAGDSATVTVQVLRPPGGAPSISAPIINTTGSFAVVLQPIWSADRYVLEELGAGGGWNVIHSGGIGSIPVSGKVSGTYFYRGTACNNSGCGSPGPSISVQVALAPRAAPALYVDGIAWEGESYPVSWTGVTDATSYELVSDYNTSYSYWSVYSGSDTSWWSPGQGAGLYGYMVRGCNWVGCGPWSAKHVINVYSSCSYPPCDVEVVFRKDERTEGDE